MSFSSGPADFEDSEATETQVIPQDVSDAAANPSVLQTSTWGKLVPLGNQRPVVLDGDEAITIGRSNACHVTISNRVVSSVHLSLQRTAHTTYIATDSSSNGTLVSRNGSRSKLEKGKPFGLEAGDMIRLSNIDGPLDEDEHLAYLFHPTVQHITESVSKFGKRTRVSVQHDGVPESASKRARADETAANPEAPTKHHGAGASEEMEQTLICSICREIYHDPVGLVPCMHCVCAGCWVQLRNTGSKICPECRTEVQHPRRNTVVAQLTAAFLHEFPSKQRPADETDALDQLSKNLITDLKREEADAGAINEDSYESNSGSESESESNEPEITCRECLTERHDGFQCADDGTAVHDTCWCCGQPFPARANIPGTKCKGCGKTFCCIYFGIGNCSGCTLDNDTGPVRAGLRALRDIRFADNTLHNDCALGHPAQHHCILNSRAEREILADHLDRKNMSATDLFKDCVLLSRSGAIPTAVPDNASDDDFVCRPCAQKFFCSAAYVSRDLFLLYPRILP